MKYCTVRYIIFPNVARYQTSILSVDLKDCQVHKTGLVYIFLDQIVPDFNQELDISRLY